ncbi:MAG: lipocalin-like domain-containing protein [Acidobacteriota bacterium]
MTLRPPHLPTTRLLVAAAFLLGAGPVAPSPLAFPRDHGSHADAAVEWWYYTGHLTDAQNREYGFQLTFFRAGELHLAHFAWTDVGMRTFHYEEKAHLGLPGVAGAEAGRLKVFNEDWSAEEASGTHRLRVAGRDEELELTLRPSKGPVLNGPEGISRKGPGEKEYSHYVSITRLTAVGRLRRAGSQTALSGMAWFDHEWGPGALPSGAQGWDWFAVQLSDGSDLMLYRMRDRDGRATPFSSGTFVPERGDPAPVSWGDVRFEETGSWTSPRTKARYPAGWKIGLAPAGLSLTIQPLLADQELVTEKSTGVTYWEGACRVEGSRAGRPVTGRAYAELTGYAGRDVPGFAN